MTTVVFVHGAGVRRPALDMTVRRIRRGLPGVDVVACDWGSTAGANLRFGGASIPRGIEAPAGADVWAVLELDPLFELGILALGEAADDPDTGYQRVAGLPADPGLTRLLAESGLDEVFFDVVAEVMASPPARSAIRLLGFDPLVCCALARAFVAAALVEADDQADTTVAVCARTRDEIVVAVAELLGCGGRTLLADMTMAGARLARTLGVLSPAERRTALTRGTGLAAADVLRFVSDGAPMRRALAETIAGVPGAIVLIGHGIGAAIALLEAEGRTLVTVGSPVAYLYEVELLAPSPTARWLNIYDRQDLAAFTAESVLSGCTDHRIDNGVPYPRSHTAYFDNPEFYELVTPLV